MTWEGFTTAAAWLLYGWLLVILGLALALALVEAACAAVDYLTRKLAGR